MDSLRLDNRAAEPRSVRLPGDGMEDVNETRQCPNCGVAGAARFCSACGQERGNLFPSIGSWFRELLSESFAIEGKLPRTVRALVWPPGQLTREWYDGRRARYVSPLRLYLSAGLLFFFSWRLTPWSVAMVDFAEGLGKSAEGLVEIMPAVMILFLVPIFGALVHIMTSMSAPFVGDVVLALHTHTVLFLWIALTVPLRMTFGHGWDIVGTPAALAILTLYLCGALVRVHGLAWGPALARTLVVLLIYSGLACTTIGVILLYMLPTG